MTKAYQKKLVAIAKELLEFNADAEPRMFDKREDAELYATMGQAKFTGKLNQLLGFILALEEEEVPSLEKTT